MNKLEIARYVGAICDITFTGHYKVTGRIVKGITNRGQEAYYLVKLKDILDYKVAFLQKDYDTMNRMQSKIDLFAIGHIELSKHNPYNEQEN